MIGPAGEIVGVDAPTVTVTLSVVCAQFAKKRSSKLKSLSPASKLSSYISIKAVVDEPEFHAAEKIKPTITSWTQRNRKILYYINSINPNS